MSLVWLGMTKYLVTYDLRGRDETSKDYEDLIKEIKSFDHVKLQKSVWLIKSDLEASEIRDLLKLWTDDNDRLYVTPISRGASWRSVICGSDTLKAFLNSA